MTAGPSAERARSPRTAWLLCRGLLLVLLVLSTLPAGSCRTTGEECDVCAGDNDCRPGLFCVSFSDGSRRCGSGLGATTCRTR
jgi:hypothetical protein